MTRRWSSSSFIVCSAEFRSLLEIADCVVHGLALVLVVEQKREVVGTQP